MEKELGEELVRHLLCWKRLRKRARQGGPKSWSEVEALGPRRQGPTLWSTASGKSPEFSERKDEEHQNIAERGELEEIAWTSRMNSWSPGPSLKDLSKEVEALQRKILNLKRQ